MSDISAVFGANLRAIRIARGWTPAELAIKAGVTRGTVRNAEMGRGITLHTAHALAEAAGAGMDELTRTSGVGRENFEASS